MTLTDQLLEIETKLWTEGAEYYRDHLDQEAIVAFGRMAGAMSKDEVAATVTDGPRWSPPRIEVKGCIEPTPGFALLTYQAHAERPGSEPYDALVSSGYVRRNGSWKLAFHQQTPD